MLVLKTVNSDHFNAASTSSTAGPFLSHSLILSAPAAPPASPSTLSPAARGTVSPATVPLFRITARFITGSASGIRTTALSKVPHSASTCPQSPPHSESSSINYSGCSLSRAQSPYACPFLTADSFGPFILRSSAGSISASCAV